ncbi:hypothetical protein ACKWMY_22060, partial [Serratia sp. J2]|uniref:hypothetical protein n=1 Tax=Serratia sp. J2 TaxID=3386551 RepID=UPI0039173AA0
HQLSQEAIRKDGLFAMGQKQKILLSSTFSHSINREHQEHQCEQPGVVGELVPLQDAGSKKKDGILRRDVSGLDRFPLLRVRGPLSTKQTKDSLLYYLRTAHPAWR